MPMRNCNIVSSTCILLVSFYASQLHKPHLQKLYSIAENNFNKAIDFVTIDGILASKHHDTYIGCENLDRYSQFLVRLTDDGKNVSAFRKSLDVPGTYLLSYSSKSGFLVLMREADARGIRAQPFVRTVLLRASDDKLQPDLISEGTDHANGSVCALGGVTAVILATVASDLFDPAKAAGNFAGDAWHLSKILSVGLQIHLGGEAAVRAVADHKLEVTVPGLCLFAAAKWLAARPEVVWVERLPTYAARNFAAGKLLLSGPSDSVLHETSFDTTAFSLDGTGQAMFRTSRYTLPHLSNENYAHILTTVDQYIRENISRSLVIAGNVC